jgi:hypothetical protein
MRHLVQGGARPAQGVGRLGALRAMQRGLQCAGSAVRDRHAARVAGGRDGTAGRAGCAADSGQRCTRGVTSRCRQRISCQATGGTAPAGDRSISLQARGSGITRHGNTAAAIATRFASTGPRACCTCCSCCALTSTSASAGRAGAGFFSARGHPLCALARRRGSAFSGVSGGGIRSAGQRSSLRQPCRLSHRHGADRGCATVTVATAPSVRARGLGRPTDPRV